MKYFYSQTITILLFAAVSFLAQPVQSESISLDLFKVPVERHQTLRPSLRGKKEEVKIHEYQSSHYYMTTMYFGSERTPANLTVDMGSSQTLVTSELCNGCPSKAFVPGKSKSVKDQGTQWDLKYPQYQQRFKTIAYKDDICWDNQNKVCANSFTFYAIYKQRNMLKFQDGILGVGPIPAEDKSDKGDSILWNLAKQKKIKRPAVSVFISKYEHLGIPSNLMLGDFNTTYIEGGEDAITWFDLTNDTDWQVYLSWAHFGDKQLFEHDFKPISVNLGVPYIGVDDETFEKLQNHLTVLDSSIVCDQTNCYGTKPIRDYTLPDYSMKLSNKKVFTIPGEQLMDPAGSNSTYTCKFAIFNSGYHFVLGEYFLRDHYAIFDLSHYRMGLAVSKNFAPNKEPVVTPTSNDDDQKKSVVPKHAVPDQKKKDPEYTNETMITIGMAALFIAACGFGYFMVRRRRLRQEDKLRQLQAEGITENLTNSKLEESSEEDNDSDVASADAEVAKPATNNESPNDVLEQFMNN